MRVNCRPPDYTARDGLHIVDGAEPWCGPARRLANPRVARTSGAPSCALSHSPVPGPGHATRYSANVLWRPRFSHSGECNVPQRAAFRTGLSQKEPAFKKNTDRPPAETKRPLHRPSRPRDRPPGPQKRPFGPPEWPPTQPQTPATAETSRSTRGRRTTPDICGESELSAGEADYRY